MTFPVSLFIITFNEADRLGQVLQAVQGLAGECVVVDSGSTDSTQDLARSFGAKVIENPWPGYGPQKRFAEDQCSHAWLLNLDADEIPTPELIEEIRALFAKGEPPQDAYTIRITEVFPTEKTAHRFAYALEPVRLYKRSKGRYSASIVHDRVQLDKTAKVGRLTYPVMHVSVRSLGDQITKLNRYSDAQAEDMARRGVRLATMRIFFEFPLAFLKAYFVRRHFLRGIYGFLTAMNYAISRHLRIAKHFERREKDKQAS